MSGDQGSIVMEVINCTKLSQKKDLGTICTYFYFWCSLKLVMLPKQHHSWRKTHFKSWFCHCQHFFARKLRIFWYRNIADHWRTFVLMIVMIDSNNILVMGQVIFSGYRVRLFSFLGCRHGTNLKIPNLKLPKP